MKKWWRNMLNRMFPIDCHHCGHVARDWAERIQYKGRLVWMQNGFYEGGVEEFYCPDHLHLMPEPQNSQEARRRFYSGERQ